VIVLDASAFLAYAQNEPGTIAVQAASAQDQLAMSAVNHSEVVQKLALRGIVVDMVENVMDELGVAVVPFTHKLSVKTAQLFRARSGLSLADRACLATAGELGATAMTADKAWTSYDFGVQITMIR
jgi:ribonuclease VapC